MHVSAEDYINELKDDLMDFLNPQQPHWDELNAFNERCKGCNNQIFERGSGNLKAEFVRDEDGLYTSLGGNEYYLLRYGMAYTCYYALLYRVMLNLLDESPLVATFGMGAGLDIVALKYALSKGQKNCLAYYGKDLRIWPILNHREGIRYLADFPDAPGEPKYTSDQFRIYQRYDCETAEHYFANTNHSRFNILFFPKSVSEFNDETLDIINQNRLGFSEKRVVICFAYSCQSTEISDRNKEQEIHNASIVLNAIERFACREGYSQPRLITNKSQEWGGVPIEVSEQIAFRPLNSVEGGEPITIGYFTGNSIQTATPDHCFDVELLKTEMDEQLGDKHRVPRLYTYPTTSMGHTYFQIFVLDRED